MIHAYVFFIEWENARPLKLGLLLELLFKKLRLFRVFSTKTIAP